MVKPRCCVAAALFGRDIWAESLGRALPQVRRTAVCSGWVSPSKTKKNQTAAIVMTLITGLECLFHEHLLPYSLSFLLSCYRFINQCLIFMQCLPELPLAMAVLNLLSSAGFTEHLESPWHSAGCWGYTERRCRTSEVMV